MRPAVLIALLLLFCSFQSPARGDIPLSSHLTYTQPSVEFPGVNEQSEYVFHLRFQTFFGGPTGVYTYAEVKDSKAFTLKASRRIIDMQLLAMKREEFAKRAKEDSTLSWLTDKTEGVLSAKLNAPSTVIEKANKTTPVTKYAVMLKDGKLTVATELPKSDKSDSPIPIGWINIVIATALSLSFIAIGWYFRRVRKPQRSLLAAT